MLQNLRVRQRLYPGLHQTCDGHSSRYRQSSQFQRTPSLRQVLGVVQNMSRQRAAAACLLTSGERTEHTCVDALATCQGWSPTAAHAARSAARLHFWVGYSAGREQGSIVPRKAQNCTQPSLGIPSRYNANNALAGSDSSPQQQLTAPQRANQ